MARSALALAVVAGTVGVMGGVAGGMTASGPALGGPMQDISFQDGRTSSLIRSGDINPKSAVTEIGDPEDLGSIALCYAEGTVLTPQMHEAMLDAQLGGGGYGTRYNIGARWAGTAGSPIALTWSLVPDGVNIPSGVGEPAANSNLFSAMNAKFGAANQAVWVGLVQQSFDRWSALSGITYTRITSGGNQWDDGAAWGSNSSATRGQVRIGGKNIDNNSGILAYNAFPSNGDMVLDTTETWQSSSNNYRFFRNTVMHEHGHGLGFAHVCSTTTGFLMEPFLSTSFDGPQQDEIRAVQRSYADPFEPNENTATATILDADGALPLTPIGAGSTLTIGTIPAPAVTNSALCSMDVNGDIDFYNFAVSQPRLVTLTLTPIGSAYNDDDQDPNTGNCLNTGFTTNAAAQANLQLTVSSSTGASTYRIQNATGLGQAEVITDILIQDSAYARVTETDSPTESQLYTLSVSPSSTNLTPSATDGEFDGFVRVNWIDIPDATGYQILRNTVNDLATAVQVGAVIPAVQSEYDDAPPSNGVPYFYWVRAAQTGGPAYRLLSLTGTSGFSSVPNAAPNADAGPDQTVTDSDGNGTQAATLNGASSSDSDGAITSYVWKEGATQIATGVSPSVAFSVGVHTVTLTVTDNDLATDIDTVVITVDAQANTAPNADAGADQTVIDADNTGAEIVILDGDASADSDGVISNYLWTEGATVLSDGPASNPAVSLGVGVHVLTLTVTDDDLAVDTDTVTITVEAGPTGCGSTDFDGDGDAATDADIEAFFSVVGGLGCPTGTCGSTDFDGDGDEGTDADIETFFRVLGGGPCTL